MSCAGDGLPISFLSSSLLTVQRLCMLCLSLGQSHITLLQYETPTHPTWLWHPSGLSLHIPFYVKPSPIPRNPAYTLLLCLPWLSSWTSELPCISHCITVLVGCSLSQWEGWPCCPSLYPQFLTQELMHSRSSTQILEQRNGQHWFVNLVWAGGSVLLQQQGLSGPAKDLVWHLSIKVPANLPLSCNFEYLDSKLTQILSF